MAFAAPVPDVPGDSGAIRRPDAPRDRLAKDEPAGILVRFRQPGSAVANGPAHRRAGGATRHVFEAPRGLELVELPAGTTVDEGLARYRADPAVERASRDWPLRLHSVPDDPRFPEQWPLENTGQNGGTPDADINAAAAWDVTTGRPEVVVGVIDSGIDYTHPDLVPNLWVNELEVPGNGVDDDGNGWVDDVHGIDALAWTGDPMDDLGHGTAMSGLIASAGNNRIGMAGVGWSTRIVACRAIDTKGGKLSTVLVCMDYLRALRLRAAAPVDIVAINASWGGIPYSQELADSIAASRAAGIAFITSAGNSGNSVEDPTTLEYPGRYGLPLVVSVGASNPSDELAWFSAYGPTAVHLLAPGESILAPVPGGEYQMANGTSQAAAVTTGVAALIAAASPSKGPAEITALLVAGAQPVAGAQGVTASGRRLRARDGGGLGALSCAGQRVRMRVAPPGTSILAVRGRSAVPLSMLSVECETPAGPATVVVDGSESVALADDGAGGDPFGGDGVFAGTWTVPGDGAASGHTLAFSGGDTVTVRALDAYLPARAVPFEWRTIRGQELPLGDDDSASIWLPFAVPFGRAAGGFSHLWVHANGYVDFSGTTSAAENEPLPSRRLGTAIAPFWDDLDPAMAGQVTWALLGAAPHRELVIEWSGVAHHQAGGTLTFQAVLFEDRPDVVFNYADVTVGDPIVDGGASATVGLQEAAPAYGGMAIPFSTDAASLAPGTSLLWRANQPPSAEAGATVGARGGSAVTVDGSSSSDPDGTIARYAWRQTSGPGVVLGAAQSAATTFVAPAAPALLELELTVTDAEGASSRDRTLVVVDDYTTAIELSPATTTAQEGEEVAVTMEVSDPDSDAAAGGPYRVSWSWGDGAADAVSLAAPASLVITHVFADDDGSPFELSAAVTDATAQDGSPTPRSLAAYARVPITVTNVPPRIERVEVTPRGARAGDRVTIEVTATDPGSDPLAYSFDFDGDGNADVVDSPEPRAAVVIGEGWRNEGTVLVRDDDGGRDEAALRLTSESGGDGGCGCGQGAPPSAWVTLALALALARRMLASRSLL